MFQRTQFNRTIIFGNTASGKSWLSKRLETAFALPVVELDMIRWVNGDYSKKESVENAVATVSSLAQNESWVIEGVYGWLAEAAIHRATALIWTDIPWEESRQNLLDRETARGSDGNFEELETWSADYWTRNSDSSFRAHERIFGAFSGPKLRLSSTADVTRFAEALEKY